MDWEPFARLLVAAALTALIGLDRELRAKSAGLRTNIVVGVAAAGFSYASIVLFPEGDPGRVAAQIVTGVGFLGGGAIFASGGRPHGLTTAAALWGSAAVGLAAGIGAYDLAVAIAGVTVVVLWPLDPLTDRFIDRHRRADVGVRLVVDDVGTLRSVQHEVSEAAVRLRTLDLSPLGTALIVSVVLHGRPGDVADLTRRLARLPGVGFVSGETVAQPEE